MIYLRTTHPNTFESLEILYTFRYNMHYTKKNNKYRLIGTTTCRIVGDDDMAIEVSASLTNYVNTQFVKQVGRTKSFERAISEYVKKRFPEEPKEIQKGIMSNFLYEFERIHVRKFQAPRRPRHKKKESKIYQEVVW